MGCDIHAVVQVRVNGDWTTVPAADIPVEVRHYWLHDRTSWEPMWEVRSYVQFGILAGVRDRDVTPIVAPRGLPSDTTIDQTEHGSFAIDGRWLGDHTYSWVTATELVGYPLSKIHPKWEEPLSELTSFDVWVPWLCTLGNSDDVRLVFGFDS